MQSGGQTHRGKRCAWRRSTITIFASLKKIPFCICGAFSLEYTFGYLRVYVYYMYKTSLAAVACTQKNENLQVLFNLLRQKVVDDSLNVINLKEFCKKKVFSLSSFAKLVWCFVGFTINFAKTATFQRWRPISQGEKSCNKWQWPSKHRTSIITQLCNMSDKLCNSFPQKWCHLNHE